MRGGKKNKFFILVCLDRPLTDLMMLWVGCRQQKVVTVVISCRGDPMIVNFVTFWSACTCWTTLTRSRSVCSRWCRGRNSPEASVASLVELLSFSDYRLLFQDKVVRNGQTQKYEAEDSFHCLNIYVERGMDGEHRPAKVQNHFSGLFDVESQVMTAAPCC